MPPTKKKSVFDRMATMASGDMAEPGSIVDAGDGFVTVAPGKRVSARVEAAKVALSKKPPKKIGVKKPTSQPVEQLTMSFGGAVTTRKVGVGKASASLVKLITAWSFSRYKTYLECPLKAKLKFIDGMKEPGSAAMDRGSEIHGLAEKYARGQLKNLPVELAKFKAEFLDLVKKKPECEGEWAFTKDWFETGWFERGVNAAWCRVKTDVAYYDKKTRTVYVIDHKTGKPKPDHPDQLSLYALASFIKYPDALRCVTKLWYLDTGDETTQEFTADSAEALKVHWNNATRKMLTDTKFAATPSKGCSWCHFRKANGGPCKW